MSFAVSTMAERLTDSSPLVVTEVLRIGKEMLKILPAERQLPLLLAALGNDTYVKQLSVFCLCFISSKRP